MNFDVLEEEAVAGGGGGLGVYLKPEGTEGTEGTY